MIKKRITPILIGFSIFVFAYAEPIDVGKGTLKLGGILQTTLSYTQDTLSPQTSFKMSRARFLFFGAIIPDKVKYFIQTEATGSPLLLDTKLQFFYLPKTEITCGRFLPNFTYYMPQSTAKLDLVNYPLVTTKYAVWRQVGIQTTTTTDYLDLNLGVFNGYPANNLADNNDAKDLLGRATFKLLNGIQLFGYAWMGNLLMAEDTDLENSRYGGGISIERNLSENGMAIVLRGEYLMAGDEDTTNATVNSMAYYGHAEFRLNPQIGLLVRYDGYDANTDVADNGLNWITGGVNFYLAGTNVMFYLNYIKKINDVPSGSSDPDDDEVILQAQVAF